MTKGSVENLIIEVVPLEWCVVFNFVGSMLMGKLLQEDHENNSLEFFSKEAGLLYLNYLRIVLSRVQNPMPKGVFELLQDEIRFSELPDRSSIPENLPKLLLGKVNKMDETLRRQLLSLA